MSGVSGGPGGARHSLGGAAVLTRSVMQRQSYVGLVVVAGQGRTTAVASPRECVL